MFFFSILILSRVTIDQSVIAGIIISTKYLYVTLYEDLVGQTQTLLSMLLQLFMVRDCSKGSPREACWTASLFCLIPIKTHQGSGAKNVAISLDILEILN